MTEQLALALHIEPEPIQWTPRCAMSVIGIRRGGDRCRCGTCALQLKQLHAYRLQRPEIIGLHVLRSVQRQQDQRQRKPEAMVRSHEAF